MFKRRKRDNGFTLIELLSIILILTLVFSFSIFIIGDAISKSKAKSYKVTINNIENMAGSYLVEGAEELFYISKKKSDNLEYQCIVVQDLIDSGFFKNDILSSKVSDVRNVEAYDFVYVERNIDTKVITKTEYLMADDNTSVLCFDAINATGDINIMIAPDGWSSYKEITLKYRVKNYYDIDDYTFSTNISCPIN